MLTTVEALDDGRLADRRAGWVTAATIGAMALVLRLVGLGFPRTIMFDETYYAKDAYSILKLGWEAQWKGEGDVVNKAFADGDFSALSTDPSFIVHPPLGKLLIGWGAELFNWSAFGWRFSAAIFGALMVFLVVRLARRLSRSTLVGAIAGLLVTFDGLAFVMSRIALLDIFQATLAVGAVAALVADRDWFRRRLSEHLRRHDLIDLGGRFGPLVWWRPWRILAGLLFGLSCAVKWNTIYVVAVFGVVAVVWDLGARRLAGAGRRSWLSLLSDAPAAFVQLVVVAIPAYLVTWYRWLTMPGGYDRDWGSRNPDSPLVRWFGDALGSLFEYHRAMYAFHTGDGMKEATHPYEAHPAGWLVMARPIGIYAENGINPPDQGCQAVGTTCLRVITAMGTPLLWWMAALALLAGLWFWLAHRDWRFAVPVLGVLSVWLPWFQYAERPLFFFYAIMLLPFYAIGLAMVMGRLLGPANGPRRRIRAMGVGIAVALVVADFAFIHPILTAALMTRPEWLARMWFPTWI